MADVPGSVEVRRWPKGWLAKFGISLPRPARFLLVGLIGVGVNNAVLLALVDWAGFPLLLAGALAIETAIWNNFLLNDLWTFGRGRRFRPLWARAIGFHATAALAAAINLSILAALVSWAGLHHLPANLIAIAVAAGINYSASAIWTWRPRPFSLATQSRVDAWSVGERSKKIVVIPTYNEAANIRPLLAKILTLSADYEAIIVDDNSPDGTADLVAKMAAGEPRIHLLQRPAKLGLGSAYVMGFRRALALEADLIFQMDADFSHDTEDLLRLAQAAQDADVVIGSRYISGGSTPGWPARRRLLSQLANLACRLLLGLPLHDATGGLKCWRRRALEVLPLEQIQSSGFAFQIEMNYLAWQAGFLLVEVPVRFLHRRAGRSKLSLAIALEAALLVLRLSLGWRHRYYLAAAPGQRGQ